MIPCFQLYRRGTRDTTPGLIYPLDARGPKRVAKSGFRDNGWGANGQKSVKMPIPKGAFQGYDG